MLADASKDTFHPVQHKQYYNLEANGYVGYTEKIIPKNLENDRPNTTDPHHDTYPTYVFRFLVGPSGVPEDWFCKEIQAKWKAGPETRTAPQGCQNIGYAKKFKQRGGAAGDTHRPSGVPEYWFCK